MKKLSLILFSLFTYNISSRFCSRLYSALTEVTVTSSKLLMWLEREITPIAFSSVSGAEIDLKSW